MLAVTTLYASTAAATAGYYTQYLTEAEGEIPGRWTGKQDDLHGLAGDVNAEQLEMILSGRHPVTGVTLGFPLQDRTTAEGRLVRAVSGLMPRCPHPNRYPRGGRSPATTGCWKRATRPCAP